jgi:hypothetical protein
MIKAINLLFHLPWMTVFKNPGMPISTKNQNVSFFQGLGQLYKRILYFLYIFEDVSNIKNENSKWRPDSWTSKHFIV